jgi:hypothetical protein
MTEADIREMPAGPEMDALVAELVMGWRPYENGRQYCDLSCGLPADRDVDDFIHYSCSYEIPDDWSPSTDIAAAWLVIDKMRAAGWWWKLESFGGPTGGWSVVYEAWTDHMDNPELTRRIIWRAETVPLSICRAALLTTVGE